MHNDSLFTEIRRKLDIYSPRPQFYSFVMSENEKLLFDKTVKNSKHYLEFGAGGSTLRVLQYSKAKIYSTDSDLNWIRFLRKYWLVRYFESRRLHFFYVDIGRTKEWGYPVGYDSEDLFPDYSATVFKSIEKTKIDTVLIDGRFRIACVLKTILECSSNKDLVIIIHDFWNRPAYSMLQKYLVVINQVDTMGVFKIRANLNQKFVKKDYELYKFDYR